MGSVFGAYAQDVVSQTQPAQVTINLPDLSALLGTCPEINGLQTNLGTIENSLKQIEQTAKPLYDAVAPTNMEAMSISERIKAIVGNTKSLVNNGVQSYQGQVAEWNAAHGITADSTFETELSVGLNEVGIQASSLPLNGKGDVVVSKLKSIIEAIKTKLQTIINVIKAKIVALAQKVGLMKETDEGKSSSKDAAQVSNQSVQQADTFSAKLSKGVSEGTENAKQSLKSSFSLSNLAVTTAVAVGTNLALQKIKGEKLSIGTAVKTVASLEFAGSVVGSALGAAGGQFCSTLVKTFIPGPIGCLVGAVIPVMMSSAAGQVGSSLAGDAKQGQFDIVGAIKKVDKVDLLGSSIGSTIGMALGAPIPIIGPIIGGILGGIIGSKVANYIFRGKNITLPSIKNWNPLGQSWQVATGTSSTGGISVGTVGSGGGQSLGVYTGGQINNGGLIPVADQSSAQVAGDIQTIEKKYYETYLKYNKLVEAGKYDEAKKVYSDLKVYSDQYNAMKSQSKETTK